MSMDYDSIKVSTIYPSVDPYGEWEACGWITYGKSSVLEGQRQEIPVEWFDTLNQAKAKYPNATVSECPREKGVSFDYTDRPLVSDSPPSWFDPADAGEHWHEDDY